MSGSVTKLRQKQITGSIDMSTTAVDAVTIGSGLLSASNLQEDLNNVRALFKDMKGTTAWYGNATYQLTGTAAHGSAIALDASNGSGGIDIDAGAAITIDAGGALSLDAGAASNFSTAAGALTLDGKTGVNLQVNGTQVLGVGTSGLYVSGNVSSFTVTGAIRSPAATGVRFPEGISGSITRLSNGKSFIEAGSNIVITSGSNTAITIGVTGVDASPTGSKARNFYDVTGTYANGSEIIIHGNGATSQTGFNNLKARHDPYGALDVYLNGQYMQSGTSAANGDYSVGIGCTTTGSIKFFFNLEEGDVIGTFEVNR